MFLLALLLTTPPPDQSGREALTRYGHARWLAGHQQPVSAARQLEAARKLDPASTVINRDLVKLYAELGRENAAIRVAKDVLATDPADAVTAQTLARLLADGKQFKDAAVVLSASVDSPRLVKEPARKLRMLTELARHLSSANEQIASAEAWQRTLKFIDANEKPLLNDGYDTNDLRRERAATWEKLGQICVTLKRFPEAITAFQTAASHFGTLEPHAAARLHWNLSGAQAASGDSQKALESLQKFLKMQPQSPAPYRRYANLMRQAGRDRDVEPGLAAMATAAPKVPAIRWVHLAEMARRDFPSAHYRFLELLNTTTDEAFFELLVNTYVEQRRADELLAVAEEVFPYSEDKAVTVTPAQSDRRQAFAAALGGHTSFAAALLKATRVPRPRSAQLWELLGWLAEKADLPEELERALRQSFQANRGEPSALALDRLTSLLARQRRWNELLTLCDSISGFEAYRVLLTSEALAELGRGDEALAILKDNKALANFALQRQTAHVLGILGRHPDMLAALDTMLLEFKALEDVRRVKYLRADALGHMNRFDELEAELRAILEDDPDDVLALNNLGYNLADKNRKLPEAERLIRRALEIDCRERVKAGEPQLERGVYLDSLGWVLFRRGQLMEARSLLEKAANLPDGRSDAVVWDHLGDVCFRLGDKPAAKNAWTKAVDRYVGDHRGRDGGRADEAKRKLKLVE